MNPVVEFFNLLDAISMKLLGLHFSIGNIAVLAVVFWFGTLFGRLTRHLTVFRTVIALILGGILWDFFTQVDFPFLWAFLLGVIAKHSYLYLGVLTWARDLGDVFFAMRYRNAFEDIRRREEELEELVQELKRKAREQARSEGQSNTQKQWQEQARQQRQRQEGPKPGSSSSGGQQQSRQQERPSSSNTGSSGMREKHLKTMGLDPSKNYSKDDLKKAYRKRAMKTHPDTGGSKAAFQELNEANQWLESRAA